MYFKKLEVYGFKSFVDKTTLLFESGVTAIVGPNGTGKSNIADAIKWVLGEQSAKSMRGAKMEDVIFNGTESRPPVNMAEVSLTLSNESRQLPIDYDEVMITRRLYRSGESEYLLNKTPVRLKDIGDLLMGTGIGTESYSLLEQGRIDAIISSKPDDRRAVFEEASGITRYKKQKDEALRKLKQTEENLSRVNDIVTEVSRQLSSIQRQVGKARRYQEYFEQLKILETGFAWRQYRQLQDRRNGLGQDAEQARTMQQEIEAAVQQMTAVFDDLRATLNEIDAEYAAFSNAVVAAQTEREKAEHSVQLAGERCAELQDRIGSLQEAIVQARTRAESMDVEWRQLEQRLESFSGQKQHKIDVLREKQAGLQIVEQERDAAEAVVRSCRDTAAKFSAEQFRLKNDLTRLSNDIQHAEARAQRLQQEYASLEQEAHVAQTALSEQQTQCAERTAQVAADGTRLDQLRAQEAQLSADGKKRSAQLAQIKERLITRQSQCSTLENLVGSYEGFSGPVKEFMNLRHDHPELFRGVHGVLLDLIEVTPGYEVCVECVLGDYLQAVVVENRAVLQRLQNMVDERGLGRVRFVARLEAAPLPVAACPLPGVRSLLEVIECERGYRPLLAEILAQAYVVDDEATLFAGARQLSEQIYRSKPFRPVLRTEPVFFSLLAPIARDVYIVGDFNRWTADEQSRLHKNADGVWQGAVSLLPGRNQYKFMVDGYWITDPAHDRTVTDLYGNLNSYCDAPQPQPPEDLPLPDAVQFVVPAQTTLATKVGVLYGSSAVVTRPSEEQQAGLIAQKLRIRRLQEEIAADNQTVSQLEAQVQEQETVLAGVREEARLLAETFQQEQLNLAHLTNACRGLEQQRQTLVVRMERIAEESARIVAEQAALRQRDTDCSCRLQDLERELASNDKQLSAAQETAACKHQERETVLLGIAEAKTECSLLDEQEAALRSQSEMLRHNLREQRQLQEDSARQLETDRQRIIELEAKERELRTLIEEAESRRQQAQEQLSAVSGQRERTQEQHRELQQSIREQEQALQGVRNHLRDIDVESVQINYKIESLSERMRQAYRLEIAELPAPDNADSADSEPVDAEAQRQEIERLQEKLNRLGAVNLGAVEEEVELRQRADFLNTQKDDLLSARGQLMRAIQKINRQTREMFLETFEKTKVTFKEYFRLLFNGGDAQLHLTEAEGDVLESGIEIVVRPPGKRLQSITLLSGGEKTMTAIALLFAIFKIKPTPFCVLDEMDAPLDESNIDRFTRALQEFLKDSQFIIITHNKKTIGMADVMYGVTMEKPGVSRLVSVKFTEYADGDDSEPATAGAASLEAPTPVEEAESVA